MAGENSNIISNISGGCNEGLSDIQYFSEGGVYYAFAPALDLLGYGLTQDEAQRSLEVVFQEYIRYGVENNTLDKDLRKRGRANKADQSKSTTTSPSE